MNRRMQALNFAGVLVLVGLCVWQWTILRRVQLQADGMKALAALQADRLTKEKKVTEDQSADLEKFRSEIEAKDEKLSEEEKRVQAAAAELARTKADRDQLQKGYDNVTSALHQWQSAVAQRDEALKKANALAQQMAADRNEAVKRYNALVGQFNAAGEEIKKAAATIRELVSERDDAIRKFNDLAAKYNALVTAAPATEPGR